MTLREVRLLFFGLGLSIFSSSAWAVPISELYRSPYMMSMGGAGLSTAEGMDALFNNPAGLATTPSAHWEIVHTDFAIAEDTYLYAKSALAGFTGFSTSTITALMGQNHFAQGQATTGLFLPYFGVGYLFGGEFGLTAANQALPEFYVTNQMSHIIQAGAGFTVGTHKRSRHERTFEFRFGGTGKLAIRKGGRFQIPLLDLMNLSLTYLDTLSGTYGTGYGFDLGTQFVLRPARFWEISAALVFLNMGDIPFSSGATTIEGDLAAGLGLSYVSGKFRFNFNWDFHRLLDAYSFAMKNHIGVSVKIPGIRAFFGIYQVYPTFGIEFDLFFVKLMLNSYAIENGGYPYQDYERRWGFGISSNLPL